MYAEVADLVSVAADGSRLVTLGAAHGGAHANFRWTVWAGDTARVIEEPQSFETFGGESAGSLLGIAWSSGGPVIAGTWAGRYGLDAAIWLPRGDRWLRQDSAETALANSAHTQVAPRALSADGRDLVLSGSVIDLDSGVRQTAAIWTVADRAAPWRLVRLPEAGRRSEALSTRCAGQSCWVSGYVDGRLAVWSITGATATRLTDVPPIPVDDAAPAARTLLLGERVGVLVSAGGRTELALRDSQGWRVFAGPAGSLVDGVCVGQRIYAAVAPASGPAALWTADAPP
jgi:hypothetical protein